MMTSIGINEMAISVLVLLNTFIIYKMYNMSITLARIQERLEWIVKTINNIGDIHG